MTTPLTGSSDRDIKLLRIKTSQFELYITGMPKHPTVEHLQLLRADDGQTVLCEHEWKALHPNLKIIEAQAFCGDSFALKPWGEHLAVPTFFEQQDYHLNLVTGSVDDTFSVRYGDSSQHPAMSNMHDGFWSARLNFRNEVGFADVVILMNGEETLRIRLEVFPAKLDYRKDYVNLLAEVNEEIYNLSFDFLRRTYQHLKFEKQVNPSLAEYVTILRHVFAQLETAMERIDRNPHVRLQSEDVIRDTARVRKAGRANIAFLTRRPGVLESGEGSSIKGFRIDGLAVMPRKLLETRRVQDYDTAENRFLRWVLRRIAKKLTDFRKIWTNGSRDSSEVLERSLRRINGQINRWRRLDWLQEVGEMRQFSLTLVLQLAPGYRELYRIYLLLMKGLSIHSDMLQMSMKDMAQLYEYWCFLKINRLLRERYELVSQKVVKANRSGVTVTLDQSRSAKMRYRNRATGEHFSLYYNSLPEQVIGPSPTVGQKPDNVFSLEKHGSNVMYHFVFDAKYRLNPAVPGDSYAEYYGGPGPEVDAINIMHRYRDAIVTENRETGKYERVISGAFVLFPYADEKRFEEHHFYKSIRKVQIGALPFLPNATRLMADFLEKLVNEQVKME
jgi:predicted component of viral defense system (DUF524 family)